MIENLTFSCRFQQLGHGLSVPVNPQGIGVPALVRQNNTVASLLGLLPELFDSQHFLDLFSGNYVPECLTPIAQAYAGHQFGAFNPFLGDGRSILLGEVDTLSGSWELSLKGAGKTPFSFVSDGRASLDECLHEYYISERLMGLGIPTTRCLCVIQGEERVYRSGFKPAAVLTRVMPSHIRFGSFENCYFKNDIVALKVLADYVIEQHYKECLAQKGDDKHDYARFFREVVVRTASLIAQWQSVGFVHGMMNTDNQSIVGVTLDLSESVFMRQHDDDFVASKSDRHGRYAFGQQPVVGLWNCNVLARALSPLIPAEDLRQSLALYEEVYLEHSES
ncbi:MAG: protein adenylyltransferase SelO family protein [Arenicella sp.]